MEVCEKHLVRLKGDKNELILPWSPLEVIYFY